MTDSRVIITADPDRAIAGFQRFRTEAVSALDNVSKAGGVIGKVLGAVGASLSIAAFTGWIKGAIDATDAASDLSQKTGIAIGDLAGMELAFKKGGMEAGSLESTMSKLSKQIVDGNEAFEKLGVKTKDASGQLKSNKDMVYELADKFADMEDGVQKTALAQEIFGKSGAAMIPMLNEGSEGLRAMDEMAHKLGLTLSEEAVENAGNFNDTLDLLALGSQGVARGIAAELLPTLSNLTGQFLTTMTSGDKLKNTAAFLAAGLRILYTAGVGIVEVFSTVGKTVGAAGAQLVAILQGNFSQAAEIGRLWQEDIGNNWTATLKSIEAAWDETSNASVDSMINFTRHSTVVGKSAAELAEESKKATKAHQDESKALAELAGLTGTFAGEWKELTDLYGKGRINLEQLTKAQAELLAKQPAMKAAADREIADRKVLTESAEQYGKAYDLAAAAKVKAFAGLQAQRDENELIGLGAQELAELNAQRLESQALRAEENAEIAEGLDLTGALAQQYRDEAAALRELADAKRDGFRQQQLTEAAKKLADQVTEDQKRVWTDIERTAHDTFISIFDSGKSAFDRLKDTLKNGLYDLLYQMTIKKWIINLSTSTSGGSLAQSITSMGSGSGGIFGTASNLFEVGKSIYNGFQTGLSSYLGQGISYVGNALNSNAMFSFGQGMQGFGAGGAGSGISGSAAGAGAGGSFSSALSVSGWVAAGMALADGLFKKGFNNPGTIQKKDYVHPLVGESLLYNKVFQALGLSSKTANLLSGASIATALFGRKAPQIESEGIQGTFSGSEFSGQAYASIVEKGGLFRSTKRYEKTGDLSADQDASFDATYKALVDAAKGFASTLGIEASVIDGYNKQIKLELGKDEAKNQEAIAKLFGGIGDELSLRLVPGLAAFTAAGETSSATLQRLATNYATVDQVLSSIGMTFGSVGAQSLEARERLLEQTGGLQAFAANAAGFQQNFLSDAERNAPVLKAVTEQMAALGFAGVDTRDEFKRIVLGMDLTTDAGAKQYATLMNMQAAFAQVYPVLENTADAAAAATAKLGEVNKGYENQINELLRARMSPDQIRDVDTKGMDPSTVALYDRLASLREEDKALQDLAGLQQRLNALTFTSEQLRNDELAGYSESNQAILRQIYAIEDYRAALDAQTEAQHVAAQSAKNRGAELLAGLDNAFSTLQSVVNREKALLQETANAHRALSSTLRSTLDGMSVAGQATEDRIGAQAQVRAALAIAKASGVLPDVDSIKGALSVLGKDSTAMFATQKDYLRDFYATQSDISDLAGMTDQRLSVEEQSIKRLDGILESARQQIDALKGIDTSILSLAEAISGFDRAVEAVKADPVASAGGQLSQLYKELLGRQADSGGLAFYTNSMAQGVTLAEIRASIMQSDEYKQLKGIPGFAKGGNHAGGLRWVGELSPELEATGASRIHSTQSLMDALRNPADSSAALVVEVRALRGEVERLRRETSRGSDAAVETARSSGQLAAQIDNATDGGNAFRSEIINIVRTKEVA